MFARTPVLSFFVIYKTISKRTLSMHVQPLRAPNVRQRNARARAWNTRWSHCDLTLANRYAHNGFSTVGLSLVARCTYLDPSGRQTCVGVRSGDHAFLRLAFKSWVASNTISKRKLKRVLGHRWTPNMRRRTVCARSRFVIYCHLQNPQQTYAQNACSASPGTKRAPA